MAMLGFAGWLVVGLLIGFIASKVVNLRGDDPRLGIASAVFGGIVGGIIYTVVSGAGVSAFNTRSILIAAVGAIVAVTLWHLVRSRTISRDKYVPRRSY